MRLTTSLLLTLMLASAASPGLPQAGGAAKANAPQPISRAVYMSRADKAFGTVDTNKDGYSDRAEIEAVETRVLAARKAQLLKQREATFGQMDKDKNGSLSLQEFNAAVASRTSKADASARL